MQGSLTTLNISQIEQWPICFIVTLTNTINAFFNHAFDRKFPLTTNYRLSSVQQSSWEQQTLTFTHNNYAKVRLIKHQFCSRLINYTLSYNRQDELLSTCNKSQYKYHAMPFNGLANCHKSRITIDFSE